MFEPLNFGITYLTNYGAVEERQLMEISITSRYRYKCDVWIGLGFDVSSNAIKAIVLDEPWVYDNDLEKVARKYQVNK